MTYGATAASPVRGMVGNELGKMRQAHSSESMPLLPPKSRGQPHQNAHEELAASDGEEGRHGGRYHQWIRWDDWPRSVAGGVILAVTVTLAALAITTQGHSSSKLYTTSGDSSGSAPFNTQGDRNSALPVHSVNINSKQAPMSLLASENTAVVAPHGDSSGIPTSSSLRNEVEDGRKSSSSSSRGVVGDVGGGGDGGGSGDAEQQQNEVVEARPPNVIFILVDDMGMNDMGPSSTDLSMVTPFMDSLADEGVRISRYYSNHLCTPARVRDLMSLAHTFFGTTKLQQ